MEQAGQETELPDFLEVVVTVPIVVEGRATLSDLEQDPVEFLCLARTDRKSCVFP